MPEEEKTEDLKLNAITVKNAADELVKSCEQKVGELIAYAKDVTERELKLKEIEQDLREREAKVAHREQTVKGTVEQHRQTAVDRKLKMEIAMDNEKRAIEKQKRAETDCRMAIERRDTMEKDMAQLLQDKSALKDRVKELEKQVADMKATDKVVTKAVEEVMSDISPELEEKLDGAVKGVVASQVAAEVGPELVEAAEKLDDKEGS